jgi:FkbM family methyltransferase
MQINGLQARVRVENIAVSDGAQQVVDLFAGRQASSSEWNIVGHDLANSQTSCVLTIPATSLDAYFPEGSRVDFVKMDIEGAEAQALYGMRDLLRRSRPLLLIEFHDDSNWEGRHCLLDNDYRLLDLSATSWIESPQDSPRVYQCLAVPRERAAQINSAIRKA